MRITIQEATAAKLRIRAEREGQDVEHLVEALLTSALTEEQQKPLKQENETNEDETQQLTSLADWDSEIAKWDAKIRALPGEASSS